MKRWIEYCSELYKFQSRGDPGVLNVHESANEDDYPKLREEVEAAVRSRKIGKSAAVDNIPAELLKHGGESVVDILTIVCNKIRVSGQLHGRNR